MTATLTRDDAYEMTACDQFAPDTMVRRLKLHEPATISLAELVEHAALTDRADRKYIATAEVVADLIEAIGSSHRVLSIDDRRHTSYRSVYFDTERFASARAHIQRRRRRWKVRSRLYVEDGLSRIEIKTKDNRGNTNKVMSRLSHPNRYGRLTGNDRDFVEFHLAEFPETDVRELGPSAEVRYNRATLSDPAAGTRVTLDWGLTMHLEVGEVGLNDQLVVVETKGAATLSLVDKTLLRLGVRPGGFSKYVSAVSALHDHLPSNDFARMLGTGDLHSRRHNAQPSPWSALTRP